MNESQIMPQISDEMKKFVIMCQQRNFKINRIMRVLSEKNLPRISKHELGRLMKHLSGTEGQLKEICSLSTDTEIQERYE